MILIWQGKLWWRDDVRPRVERRATLLHLRLPSRSSLTAGFGATSFSASSIRGRSFRWSA